MRLHRLDRGQGVQDAMYGTTCHPGRDACMPLHSGPSRGGWDPGTRCLVRGSDDGTHSILCSQVAKQPSDIAQPALGGRRPSAVSSVCGVPSALDK